MTHTPTFRDLTQEIYMGDESPSVHISHTTKKPMKTVGVFLLGYLVMLVLFGVLGAGLMVYAPGYMEAEGSLFTLFAIQQLVTGIVIWVSMRAGGRPDRSAMNETLVRRSQWKGWGLFWRRVVGGFGIYLVLAGVLSRVLETTGVTIPGFNGEQEVMTMISGMNFSTGWDWLMTGLMIVIVGPLVEEIVYRGLVTDAFMKRWKGRGVVLGAFVFALIHLDFAVFWNLFLLALILGVIYYKTESMLYTFAFHVIINGMGLFALWWMG